MLICLHSNTFHLHNRLPNPSPNPNPNPKPNRKLNPNTNRKLNPNPRPCYTRIEACQDTPESRKSKSTQGEDRRPWPSLQIPPTTQLLKSLSSYGIRTEEVVGGSICIALAVASLAVGFRFVWKKASELTSRPPRYEFIVEFPLASGITTGTPVKLRGVDVGSVVHVRPCLERIDTHIQVLDSSVYIPRNAVVEVNQSGLAGETMIDIMPVLPVPYPSFGPLHPNCPAEGLIVCDKESIRGKQGVSMDELIGLCGKMAKKSEDMDVTDLFKTAKHVAETLDNCKPLFHRTEAFLNDSEAVIEALQNNGALNDLTEFLQLLNHTAYNIRKSTLRTEDSVHFSEEVAKLTTTLKSLEDKLKDASSFMGEGKNKREIKHLIELLSRLVKA